jgi:hypothetical protein
MDRTESQDRKKKPNGSHRISGLKKETEWVAPNLRTEKRNRMGRTDFKSRLFLTNGGEFAFFYEEKIHIHVGEISHFFF